MPSIPRNKSTAPVEKQVIEPAKAKDPAPPKKKRATRKRKPNVNQAMVDEIQAAAHEDRT